MPQITSADNNLPNYATVEQSEILQMPDVRILAVQSFLDSHDCGTEIQNFDSATEFVDDADTNNIDWRILPIIWVKESSCGKHELQSTNNGFGFGNGTIVFTSFVNAVATISQKLNSAPYAHKNIQGIVSTYNNHPEYLASFMGYYAQINGYLALIPMIQNNTLASK